MTDSILMVLLIELAFIVVTVVFLIQPKVLFKSESSRLRSIANWGGMILLCLTFCWSVIVGIVLSHHGIIIGI
jgi:integral membrane sensor domain MASE1